MLLKSTFLLSFTLTAFALDFDPQFHPGRDQTVVRERSTSGSIPAIRTVYGDVRTPLGDVMPALAMDDWVQLQFSADTQRRYYDELTQGDTGRRTDVGVLARGYLWSRGVFEIEGHGEASAVANDVDIADVVARLAITAAQWRYSGISFWGGVGIPVGSGKIPAVGHNTDITRLDYQLGLRATTAVQFFVLHANIEGGWDPNGEQEYPAGWVKDGTTLTTGKLQVVNTVHATGRVGISWRPCRFGRFGAEAVYNMQWIEFSEDRLNQRTATLQAVVEANTIEHVTISGQIGYQPTYSDPHSRGGVVGGAHLLLRF